LYNSRVSDYLQFPSLQRADVRDAAGIRFVRVSDEVFEILNLSFVKT